MSQLFHHSANAIARFTLFGAVFVVAAIGWVGMELDRSAWETRGSSSITARTFQP